jgi:hypothetical protein
MTEIRNLSILNCAGDANEVVVSLNDYSEASKAGLTLGQFYCQKYPTNIALYGSPLEQMMSATGAYLSSDNRMGYRPPSIDALLNGGAMLSSITRPDGALNQTPSGRFFFPAIMLEVLQSALDDNHNSYIAQFNSMIALKRSITSSKYDQVIVNMDGPKNGVAQPIGQLETPSRILSFKTSETSKTLPRYAVGMEISAEAIAATTLDQVALSMKEFMGQERVDTIERDIGEFVNGSTDSGQTALSSVTAASFDSAIVAAGTITQKAWVKFLYQYWKRRKITDVIVSGIDMALAIEGRTNRPTMLTNAGTDERWNSIPVMGPGGIPSYVNLFILDDTSIIGANTVVGLDRTTQGHSCYGELRGNSRVRDVSQVLIPYRLGGTHGTSRLCRRFLKNDSNRLIGQQQKYGL